MRKFAGLSLAVVMCISTAIAYGMAGKANGAALNNAGSSDDEMFKSMDASLVAKLRDYLQIIDRIQKTSAAEASARPASPTNVLSGDKAAPLQARPRARKTARAETRAQPAPWWHDFELNMVSYSSKSRTAVVNGKFVREGDTVRNGVSIKKIDVHSVTLEHTDSPGISTPDPQENLKTLFIKAGKG